MLEKDVNLLPALNPVVRVWDNPLVTLDEAPLYEYQPRLGLQMRDLIPTECWRAVLIVNGQPLMQADWYRPVLPQDVIEWHLVPSSGQTSRTILTIIAIIVISYFLGPAGLGLTGFQLAAATVIANFAVQILINALIPIKPADSSNSGASASSVYNTSLSSNQARLNQPIPVIYGRMRTFPDFACQPYGFYSNNDQYYNAIFCIGQGEYAVEALQIDDTPIANFKSVYYKVLPPGVAPTRVKANFVSVIEVAGNTLETDRSIGGFTVCKPGLMVDYIEWDLVCEQGLGKADNTGEFFSFTIKYDIDIQYVDDFGVGISDYQNLLHGSLTAKSRTPQRFTFKRNLPTPGRVAVRITRTSEQDTSSYALNTIAWASLRGRLTVPAPLCSTATYLEVVMRANEQLNGLTQKKLNVIARRKIPVWTGSTWTAPQETRSAAMAIVDALRNPVYGAGRADSEIDIASFYALHLTGLARQDRLDIYFDSRITIKEATRTMAQVIRSVVFQRMGLFTITRDQYQALPSAAYTTRDIIPGSTSIGYALPTPETADAISYEYFDNRSWSWLPILCKAPGVVTPVNTVTLRVMGITGKTHALREGTYLAGVNVYRRKFPKWQTEMKGLLAAYGSAVIFSPALPNWGTPGDVADWDGATLTATLSEPVVFTPGKAHFITLEKMNGGLTIAIPVSPGPTANQVVLSLSPGFTPVTRASDVERTKFVFGPEGQHQVIVRLMGVVGKGRTPAGNPIIEMSGVAENNIVHTLDLGDLPKGGKIQDPVPNTFLGDVPFTLNTGADARSISLQNHSFGEFGVDTVTMGPSGIANDYTTDNMGGGFSFTLKGDGTTTWRRYDSYGTYLAGIPSESGTWPLEWLPEPPEPGDTAGYEVRVLWPTGNEMQRQIGNIGNWLPMNVDNTWTAYSYYDICVLNGYDGDGVPTKQALATGIYVEFDVQIRPVGATSIASESSIFGVIKVIAPSYLNGGSSGDNKVICTAMNRRMGLPNYESLVWLRYAKTHLTPEHQIGYHRVFKPLVKFGYQSGEGWAQRTVRRGLEWIAINRTDDIKRELKGKPRRLHIRMLRVTAEWLLRQIGKF